MVQCLVRYTTVYAQVVNMNYWAGWFSIITAER